MSAPTTTAPAATEWTIFGVAAVISVLLSPITVIWAVMVGFMLGAAGVVIGRFRPPWGNRLAVAGAGIAVGALPYFTLWALQVAQ